MAVLLIVAAFCGVFIILWLGRDKGKYRYDNRNPARRWCVDCGQMQHAYCQTLESWDHQWWEAAGEIKNPQCKCHKDTK